MPKSVLWKVLPLLVLLGCAGRSPRLGGDGAANMDAIAKRVAQDYLDRCYAPIAERRIPDDLCQFELFERAERQWGVAFGVAELKASANKLMGLKIETELQRLLVYDQASQRYVASDTRSRYEIIAAIKDKYRIR
ncbi:MAG: hypothetical protein IPN71_07550 [Fibrobacteres bacterium]|jgi:hypothetical protein|nr:hypothetical protein [Fibrobacterota bacterium]